MKNLYPISIFCLLFAWLGLSWLKPTRTKSKVAEFSYKATTPDSSYGIMEPAGIHSLYERLNLEKKGLSCEAFEYACKGYRHLLAKHIINKPGYLTICDFSQSSNHKRLYLLDMATNEILMNTYVAHGKNSGGEFANRFSNKPSSLQSSLGFYITNNTYIGDNGLSLRMTGLDIGYNDKALRRNIVVHGADYIEENWLSRSKSMGRSYGCPAVPKEECAEIINTIKNGTCLFIYHPSAKYLKTSKILND